MNADFYFMLIWVMWMAIGLKTMISDLRGYKKHTKLTRRDIIMFVLPPLLTAFLVYMWFRAGGWRAFMKNIH